MRARSIRDVLRLWRDYNETDCTGRSEADAGNISFSRQVLWSYRMPIACYHLSPIAGRSGFVLVSSYSPSITTSRHVSYARRESEWPKFSVPQIGCSSGGYPSPEALREVHGFNVKYMLGEINTTANAATSSYRSEHNVTQSWFVDYVATQHANVAEYVYLTAAGIELPDLDDILNRMHAERERKWLAYHDPKAMARRERSWARREAIKALNLGDN